MNKPSKSLYKRTLSDFSTVEAKSVEILVRSERFGMLPKGVLLRRDLTTADKVVFAGLALESKGRRDVLISITSLAMTCGISRAQVYNSLRALEYGELIRRSGAKVKQIQPYELLHPRLAGGVEAEETPPEPITQRRRRLQVKCPRCSRMVYGLLKVGYCRVCRGNLNIERISRRVVREEIGTPELPRVV